MPQTIALAESIGPAAAAKCLYVSVKSLANWLAVSQSGQPLRTPQRQTTSKLESELSRLTRQQFRVLLYLADGLLNKHIAHELGLAENRVKVHVTAILKKLECVSRTQAAALVKALGPEGDAAAGLDAP